MFCFVFFIHLNIAVQRIKIKIENISLLFFAYPPNGNGVYGQVFCSTHDDFIFFFFGLKSFRFNGSTVIERLSRFRALYYSFCRIVYFKLEGIVFLLPQLVPFSVYYNCQRLIHFWNGITLRPFSCGNRLWDLNA
ncbi:hypothetical protein HYC85_005779 [Camellia sinensis]|uniref:Uncharacterized protein n=1 Tax=Camellia sinensis TaxID=4442 RepID=A0A7J7I2B2_CAMSI|nr:hypothetical protein HYC85_005779 [Camellia sinensis]